MMILPQNYWIEHTDDLVKQKYNYIVLDVKHIANSDYFNKFNLALNVTNVRNAFEMINGFFGKVEFRKKLDVSILSQITDSIYTGKPFSEEQLEGYFKTMQAFEETVNVFDSISETFEDVFVDSEIEFLLMGLSLEIQDANKEEISKCDGVSERYFDLKYRYFEGKIDFKKFIEMAQNLLSEIQQIPNEEAA